MYGQRVIAEMLNFCKDIREVSEPGAIMLNYSNPNAMATWACNKYGKVRTIGLCHGEIHGEQQISEVLGIPREELDVICAGINHQTWYISVKHNGEDMIPKLLAGFEAHPKFSQEEKVRIDMLKRFGYYSTESNGHLSEYKTSCTNKCNFKTHIKIPPVFFYSIQSIKKFGDSYYRLYNEMQDIIAFNF